MSAPGHSPEWDWSAYARAFGDRLRVLRDLSDLSQIALAHRAGLTPNTVKLLERGRSSGKKPANPELRTIYRLAEALGVAPSELLPGATEVPGAVPREAGTRIPWSEAG